MDDRGPPESPQHSHSDSEESSAFDDILSSYSPITPANDAFDPESFSVLASPPPNPFTNHNSQLQEPVSHHNSVAPTPRGPIYHGQPIFDQRRPPNPADNAAAAAGFDNFLCSSSSSPQIRNTSNDNTTTGFFWGLSPPTGSGSESVDSNIKTGEMATGLLPPLSLEQIKEHFDLQRWERLMQQRSDIAPSTFCPQVDQNQHGINTFGLQFKDIQHNATTSASSFHNRPENTFRWCTDYNSQVQEPVSIHNSVAPRPIFDQRPPKPADNVAGFEHDDASGQRRGCRCKKSKCLIHCKCYRATAGCSNLCRCANCENMYGKKAAPQPQEAALLMQNEQSSVPRHNMAPTPTAPPAFQSSNLSSIHFHSYAEAAPNSRNEAGPSMAATPYGINHLQQAMPMVSSPTVPSYGPSIPTANARRLFVNVQNPTTVVNPFQTEENVILGRAGGGVYNIANDELMRSGTGFHMQQHDHPMNQFSQNFYGFGIPNPENWVINTTTNAGILFSHNARIPTANAEMLGRIPTTVNPFDTEEEEENKVFNGSAAAGMLANSSRDVAHKMLEESPTPHPNNVAVQVASSSSGNRHVSVDSLDPLTPVNPITTTSSSSRAAGEMSGYDYLLQHVPSPKGPDGAPVNPISSSSGADGEMSGYNYLLHGDPSSKGFDGGHTAKK